MSRAKREPGCTHPLIAKLQTVSGSYPVTQCLVCKEVRIHHPALGPQVLDIGVTAKEVATWNPVRTPLDADELLKKASIEEQIERGETPKEWAASIASAQAVTHYKPFPRQFDGDGPED